MIYILKDEYIYFNLGVELFKKRKYKKAFNSFVKTTKIDPDYAQAHYYKGCSLHSLNRFNEAIRAFDNAIDIDPNKGYYYASKAITLYCSNQYELAIQNVRKALQLEPNKHWAVLAQAHIYNKNFEEASKCIDKAIISYPNNGYCRLTFIDNYRIDFFKKLKLLINSGFKYGENYHIPIERSMLLLKIPPDDEIIYSTRLTVKFADKKIFTDAIITKKGISASFPLSGIQFARWRDKSFTSGNKFRMSGCNCSLHWDGRYESKARFKARKVSFREDINKLRNT